LDPIIVSDIAHHWLVSIHTFSDGNGRLSRLLGLWVLRIRGVDTHHICALDDYFEQARDVYYLKRQQARDLDDDLTYWLDYVAVGIRDTFRAVEKCISLANITNDNTYSLTRKQEEFIGFLRDHGKVSSAQLETAFAITRSRVNQIIKHLVDQGLLQREGQTRSTRYFLPKQR